jgi:hypothetical protein
MYNCGDLKEVLKSEGYGFKFLRIQETNGQRRVMWGISDNALKLVDEDTWGESSPHPYIGCTQNLQIKIAQWKKRPELCYRHQS